MTTKEEAAAHVEELAKETSEGDAKRKRAEAIMEASRAASEQRAADKLARKRQQLEALGKTS